MQAVPSPDETSTGFPRVKDEMGIVLSSPPSLPVALQSHPLLSNFIPYSYEITLLYLRAKTKTHRKQALLKCRIANFIAPLIPVSMATPLEPTYSSRWPAMITPPDQPRVREVEISLAKLAKGSSPPHT